MRIVLGTYVACLLLFGCGGSDSNGDRPLSTGSGGQNTPGGQIFVGGDSATSRTSTPQGSSLSGAGSRGPSTGGMTSIGTVGGASAIGGSFVATGAVPSTGGVATGVGGASNGGLSNGGNVSSTGGTIVTGGTATKNPWITFDPAGVVSRSNIVLLKPNTAANQFMPVGNGALGAAVWAENGITAQLNRVDTFPARKSPGWVNVPGLSKITGASDFKGTLNLYDAQLVLSGGGMTAKIYVRADSDEFVVDVTGADPASIQTATVSLWTGRSPQAAVTGSIATLAESWNDSGLGASTMKFGSLAAITAGGRNVKASASGTTATVTFQPNADGTYRVICGSPKYNGSSAAATVASTLLGTDASSTTLLSAHTAWWHKYWASVGMVKLMSTDGVADYLENMRTMYLYISPAQFRGEYPGSQAGIGDLFSFSQDTHQWVPQDYWFWNLRMMVAANLSSGAFDENQTIYRLYQSNIENMQAWTKARMGNRVGICLPETMRFNGNGWYGYTGNQSCDETIAPQWNSMTLTSGAEVSLWIWRQYLATQDKTFLQTNFPLFLESARFLMAFATTETDGKLHTYKSNAHETQWAVTDPITNIAAMRALFPVVVAAAEVVGSTDALVSELKTAIPKIPDYPRTNTTRNQVTTAATDSTNIFADSAQPTAETHNVENLDLEPVWPYDLISDTDPSLFAVAKRSYSARRFNGGTACNTDWTNDPIHAARLGLASEVVTTMKNGVGCYQMYPSGFAMLASSYQKEPYVEQLGVFAAAINEAMVQSFDGTIRIAPAVPPAWNASGTVYIQGKSKVHVQYQGGAAVFAVLEAGTSGTYSVRNPWSGVQAVVIDETGKEIVAASASATLSISTVAGHFYLVKRSSDTAPNAVQITGSAATTVKKLGTRTIGVQ